jgi:hypothetical protein
MRRLTILILLLISAVPVSAATFLRNPEDTTPGSAP